MTGLSDALMNILLLRMTPIQAYSLTHLYVVLTIAVISCILSFILSRTEIRETSVIAVCGIILALFEILKQFLLTYVRGGSYSWSDLPFQLCSTPMYLCFVYLLIPRSRETIRSYIMVFGLIGSIAAFAIPYSSFYSYAVLTFQSLAWHGILLFLSIYIFLVKVKSKSPLRYSKVSLLYLGLSCIAVLLNVCLFKISDGTCNMFFFGPGDPAVEVLRTIMAHTCWPFETIVMICATLAAGYAVSKIANHYIK